MPSVKMVDGNVAAARWMEREWKLSVKHMAASKDGSVGVLFVWTETETVYKIPDASFVIKPVTGGASTLLAEQVLTKVVGAASPNSQVVRRDSAGGRGILQWVDKLAAAGSLSSARLQAYRKADSFLLQRMMSGFAEMSKKYKEGPDALRQLLASPLLMQNLGKLAAADLILGNGDRIEESNFGNIMFSADGQVAAIDSSAILASFNQILKATTTMSYDNSIDGNGTANRLNSYVSNIARDGAAAAPSDGQIATFAFKDKYPDGNFPVLPPMARLSAVEQGKHGILFDKMRVEFQGRIDKVLNTPKAINSPTDQEWIDAKDDFVGGFELGLLAVDTLLGGLANYKRKVFGATAWTKLKDQYKRIGYSGVDPNLSWFNLVIRRDMYMMLRNGMSMDDAIKAGQAMAARKQGKMLANGRVG